MSTQKDKYGSPVTIGSQVRVLELPSTFLTSLPHDELDDISSMVGEIFEVYDIDEYGSVWVEKVWKNTKDGEYMSHSIGLSANEMELVINSNAL